MLPISHGFSEFFNLFILWHRIYLTLGLMNPSHLEILLCHPVLCRVIVYSLPLLFWKPQFSSDCITYQIVCGLEQYEHHLFSNYVWLCVCIIHGFRIFNLYCRRMLRVWNVWCLGYRRWISLWIIRVPWRYKIVWLVNFEVYS
jgi:hypothetical protein